MDVNHKQQKYLRALTLSIGVALLMVAPQSGVAAPIDSANESTQADPAALAEGNRTATATLGSWRSLTLSQGITQQDYREPDPLGRVNPLNSETGSIPATRVTLRWRGQLVQALPELALQARASYAEGQTDYNGYLQQGLTLIPYRARSGNTLQALSLRVGLPLNAFTTHQWAQHISPYAEQSWHQWQRNLTQYGETFSWQSTSLGVMALWPLADFGLSQFSRFSLEADWAIGRTSSPHMAAPSLGFAADLGSANTRSAALALHYAATPIWLFGLRYEAQSMSFGSSPIGAGLQYPGGSTNTQSLEVSLGRRF